MTFPRDLQRRIYERDGRQCQHCGRHLLMLHNLSWAELRNQGFDPRKRLWEIDHRIPQSQAVDGKVLLNGERVSVDDERNGQTLCQVCHRIKTSLDLHELAKLERIGRPPETDLDDKARRLHQRAPLVRSPGR